MFYIYCHFSANLTSYSGYTIYRRVESMVSMGQLFHSLWQWYKIESQVRKHTKVQVSRNVFPFLLVDAATIL